MKKKKDEAAAGFRETLRATLRAYKIWNRYAPKLLTSTALHSVFSALSPYVPVYFSAQILNELAGARNPEQLTTLVLLTLSVTAALALVTALLRRWKEVCSSAKYQRDLFVQLDKMLSMDFQAADAPQTHELLSQIRQNTNWYGHGLILPISYLEKLIQPIFGILGAAALTVSLFTAQAPAPAGGFSALNSPLITVLALLLLLGVTFLAPICQNKSTMFVVKSAELVKSGNRAFGFNYFTMQERSRALEQLRSGLLLAEESTSSRMNRMGSSLVTLGSCLTAGEVIERCEAVTAGDIAALAGELLAPEGLSLSAVGRVKSADEYREVIAKNA